MSVTERRLLIIKRAEYAIRCKGISVNVNRKIFFYPISGASGRYHIDSDEIYVNSSLVNEDHIYYVILHEVGHRFMHKVMKPRDIDWIESAFVLGNDDLFPTNYSRKNHKELFAEMFYLHIVGGLSDYQQLWINNFI
jgi:hypothetical protein